MVDEKVDSKDKNSNDFNFEKELSALVKKNVIPSRIAEKIERKINEKNIKINKDQLYRLANKIKDIIEDYTNSYKTKPDSKTGQTLDVKSNAEIQKLIDTVEKIQERIDTLESGEPRVVTTDEIHVPESWDIKPLTTIPTDPESIVVIMKWLQHLVDKCGHNHLSEVLDYYVDIGWLSEDAKINLIDYSQGINEEGKKTETFKELSNLPARDHIQSLLFIQKLKGVKLDKHFLEKIDGEISKITKKLDNYKFK
jgi:flagellar protein FlaD